MPIDKKEPINQEDIESDISPQEAVASNGWSKLGKAILDSKPVQNIITGEGLKQSYDLAGAAARNEPGAREMLAQQALGTAMGSLHAEAPQGGAIPRILEKYNLPLETTGRELLNHPGLSQEELAMAAQKASREADILARRSAKRYAEGGEVSTSPQDSDVSTSPQEPGGALIYNLKTNELGEIPHDRVTEAVGSGYFSFPQGNPIHVFNPDGQLGLIPPESAPQAFQSGYTYASPDQIHETKLQDQYGNGLGNEAKAAALGFGNTLSFGGLNQALVHSGLADPETLKELTNRNPISHGVGSVAGVALPLMFGDPLGAVSGVSKAGASVSRLAAEALPEASTLTGKILSNAMAKGAGSAVEGLAYGAGNVVGEEALGDPNLNAQSAMAQIGLSGLLGGALGGIIGAGELALPASVDAAKEAISKVKSGIIGEPGEGKLGDLVNKGYAKAAAFTSGKSEDDILTALQNRGLYSASTEDTEKFSSNLAKSLQDQYDAMNKASKDVFSDIRQGESESLLAGIDETKAGTEFNRINEFLTNTINDLKAEPEIYPPRYATKLEKLKDRFVGKLEGELEAGEQINPGNAHDIYSSLDDLKQNIDKDIKYGKIPSAQDEDAQNVIKTLRREIKQSLENPEVFGPAGSRQAEFNNSFSEFNTNKKEFEKKFMNKFVSKTGSVRYKVDPVKINSYLNQINDLRGTAKSEILDNFNKSSADYLSHIEKSYANLPSQEFDKEAITKLGDKSLEMQNDFTQKAEIQNAFKRLSAPESGFELPGAVLAHQVGVPAPVVAAYSAVSNPFVAIQRLAKFEKLVNKTNNMVNKGVSSLFKAGTTSAENTAGFLGSRLAPSNNKEDFQKRAEDLNGNMNNPQLLMKKLEDSTANLHLHAPNISDSIQNSAVNALQFLKSKIPNSPEMLLGPKLPPSKTDINKFNRYYEVVENPMIVFKQMKAHMLTPESIETLSTVYPSLYKKMQGQVLDQITGIKDKASIPYNLKVQLSMFMGQDLDMSLSSKSIATNQIAQGIAQQEQAQQDQGFIKPTSKGLSNIGLAGRATLPMQATAQRK